MQRTFPAEALRYVSITDVAGELVVRGWEQRSINVECEKDIETLNLEGEALIVGGARDGVVISVPYETIVRAMRVSDDVSIVNVSQAELRDVKSDCFLKAIHGEVSLGRIHGDLRVEDVRTLRLVDRVDRDASFVDVESLNAVGIGGDVSCKNIHEAHFQVIKGDFKVENVDLISASNIGRDCVLHGNGQTVVQLANVGIGLSAHRVAKLFAQNIGKSCNVSASERAEIALGNIGRELDIAGAFSVMVQNVGRECKLRDIQGDVSVRHIGIHVQIAGVSGNLRLGHVGAKAEIRGVQRNVELGRIGGNLELQALFPAESVTRLHVGGSTTVHLPEEANITVHALAGGNIMDERSGTKYSNRAVLVYSEGVAQLRIKAGGNVNLRGSVMGRAIGGNNWEWKDWQDWGNWQNWYDVDYWDTDIAPAFEQKERKYQQRVEAQGRRRYEQRRRSSERVRSARFSAREWREWWVDPARIDHIVEQARQAAADGILGALDAVEQALKNVYLSAPVPPQPPMPPSPPAYPGSPPTPVVSYDVDNREAVPDSEEKGGEPRQEPPDAVNPPVHVENVDQEREAILRMVAEGRITPEEGDMLLEALS